eukprot:TRINITY_DN25767_c0_g1_i1.p1 TRINITY_DN25767_c0_g1~~TRINITY_DN25767_c0_g1_i1.p1  ORF type:complete len:1310 (-),score=227.04 TRINITY_DN25767_c0_g1_i1:187-4071(-)
MTAAKMPPAQKLEPAPSLLSQAFFFYLLKPVVVAYRKALPEDEVPKLFPSFTAARVTERVLSWRAKALQRKEQSKRCPLWRETLKISPMRILLGTLVSSLQGITVTVGRPLALRYVVRSIAGGELDASSVAILVALLSGVVLIDGLLTVWSKVLLTDHMTVILSSFLTSLLVDKAAKSPASKASNPHNLLGNDVFRRVQDLQWSGMLPSCIGSGLGGIAMLWVSLGWPSLIGLATAFSIMGVNLWISTLTKKSEQANLAASDERVKLLKQAVDMMRGVKYFAWETKCLEQISQSRSLECLKIRRFRNFQMLSINLGRLSPVLSCLVTFFVYSVLLGNPMDAADVFSALLIFQSLRMTLIIIPTNLTAIQNLLLSFRRLENYAVEPDFKHRELLEDSQDVLAELVCERCSPDLSSEATGESQATPRVSFKEFALGPVDLKVTSGSLVAVLGPVGSGKSVLLSALLGVLPLEGPAARARTCLSVALVPQKPIIINATIIQNVTMGLSFEADRFRRAIAGAQMERDLELLPDGADTLVGERGTTLSGGQQMRVNIARALYVEPDLLVLDDPLAALDHVVGSEILQAIRRFTSGTNKQGRTRAAVMALNQTHFLQSFDDAIWLDESGKCKAQGAAMEVAKELGISIEEEHGSVDDCLDQGDVQVNVADEKKDASSPGPKEEHREKGIVKSSVYTNFFRAMGFPIAGVSVFTMVAAYLALCFADRWLAVWSEASRKDDDVNPIYPGVYAAASLGHIVLLVCSSTLFAEAGMRASKSLHWNCLVKVLKAPIAWFEDTPSGRIMSRFTADLSMVDLNLGMFLDNFLQMFMSVSVMLGIIISIVPIVAVAAVVGVIIFYFQALAVDRANRETKRAKDAALAPVQTNFSEIMNCVALLHVDAHERKLQNFFFDRHIAAMDHYNRFNFVSLQLLNFGQFVTYAICFVFSASTASLMLGFEAVDPGVSGLAFTYCFLVPYFLGITSQLAIMTNHAFTSLERLLELCSLRVPSEAWPGGSDFEDVAEKVQALSDWPAKGAIEFQDVQLRYRPELPLAVCGLSLQVRGGERLGIVGRTGAGKSSLSVLLFRLVELAGGRVLIDGVDIANLGLQKLRSSLSMIPQVPVLIQGTVRTNLDPFGDFKGGDEGMQEVLAKAQLPHVSLDADITGGATLSQGEGQLLSFARCLLRDSRIICLDEPTASVDLETDARLQELVRSAFVGRTLLCIAHRLQTIIDFDRILVMEAGRAAALDTPAALLQDPTSALSKIVDGVSGNGMRTTLRTSLRTTLEGMVNDTSQEREDFVSL